MLVLCIALVIVAAFGSNLLNALKGEVSLSGHTWSRFYKRSENPVSFWIGVGVSLMWFLLGMFLFVAMTAGLLGL